MEKRNIFGFGSWFSRDHREHDLSKTKTRRPNEVDMKGGYPANEAVLNGVYHGSVEGLQFASPMTFPPVSVPVSLVAVPTPVAGDQMTQDALNIEVEKRSAEFPLITRTKCLLGTAWRWPRYSAAKGDVIWESITDGSITDITIDPVSLEIIAIYTHDRFEVVNNGDGMVQFAERKRKITPKEINVKWISSVRGVASTMQDVTMVNPFGTMPIPFAREPGESEVRGHSVLSRVLRTLRASHEVTLNICEIASKYKPKLVVSTKNVGEWLDNNGYGDNIQKAIDDVMVSPFYLAAEGESVSVSFLPTDATGSLASVIEKLDKKAIIGSGIPEIFWPGIATGNHATSEAQMTLGVNYINSLRDEDRAAYDLLLNWTMQIKSFVEMKRYSAVKTKWDAFDMTTPEIKSRIFQNLTAGLSSMFTACAATQEDAYFFIKGLYPNIPEKSADEFIQGLDKMAIFRSKVNADYYGQAGV